MKNRANLLIVCSLLVMMSILQPLKLSAQAKSYSVSIDGSVKHQTLDGFGVNINPAWWLNGEYTDALVIQPALDMLIDSLGATIYRIVMEEIDWEKINDDKDPNHFNWEYYNKVFSDLKYQGVWNTMHYLNNKGITDGLVISFMGAAPAAPPLSKPDPKKSWMGATAYTIRENMEDELVESLAAFLYYMRNTEKIRFSLVSPMNETDIASMTKSPEHPDGLVEGPDISTGVQWVRILRKFALKLDQIGMSDIRFVAPDSGGDKLFGEVVPELVKDPYLIEKLSKWGVHQYGNDAANYAKVISASPYPAKPFWVTETAGIRNILGQLDDNATSYIFWDGFDCVYQHGRRNGYGSVPPNDWAFWMKPEDGKPLIEYIASNQGWLPRKQFYQFSQIMKFIKPGAERIEVTGQGSALNISAFRNKDGNIVVVGMNTSGDPSGLDITLSNLPVPENLKLICTDSLNNMKESSAFAVYGRSFNVTIPAGSVFTIIGKLFSPASSVKPEPEGWYAGDMHVHRNCGEGTPVLPGTDYTAMMEQNNLAVISLLADMGDGEVKDIVTDLPKVNGKDAPESIPGRIVHWDTEWHFDPYGTTFEHKALGGHVVLLGMKEAHTIWDESPSKIIEYGKAQNGVVGFCHMEYLNDSIQNQLTCCIPIDYPVEAALGTIDFLAEDVWINDAAINGYYKILNCGFRLGWAAGTDYPCNNCKPLGSLLTYVQVRDQPLTYEKWVAGIKEGRTVVSTIGHGEFIDLKVDGNSGPGDEIKIDGKRNITLDAVWTSTDDQQGSVEIVCNGKVVASAAGIATPCSPVRLHASIPVAESSWICARRMDEKGHRSHTAPVWINFRNEPVRASSKDAFYFVSWIDNILRNIEPGGPWNQYFTHDLDAVKNRYKSARSVYVKIAAEAAKHEKNINKN
jgi:O-glycosyl hydrolase